MLRLRLSRGEFQEWVGGSSEGEGTKGGERETKEERGGKEGSAKGVKLEEVSRELFDL